MLHARALSIAATVLEALSPGCKRICIAGSIRRGKPDPKDIEIVCEVNVGQTLFDEDEPDYMAIEYAVNHAINAGVIVYDPDLKRDGQKYKRFRTVDGDMAVDFFIATALNYGNILTIRTGDGDFSEKLVTQRWQGGLMPEGMRQIDGVLHRDGVVVPCLEEVDFFREIGVQWVDPSARGLPMVAVLRRLMGLSK